MLVLVLLVVLVLVLVVLVVVLVLLPLLVLVLAVLASPLTAARSAPRSPMAVVRTASSVAAMPFMWWVLARLFFGPGRLNRTMRRTDAVLLTNVAATCCLFIEDPKQRGKLAWFVMMSAVS